MVDFVFKAVTQTHCLFVCCLSLCETSVWFACDGLFSWCHSLLLSIGAYCSCNILLSSRTDKMVTILNICFIPANNMGGNTDMGFQTITNERTNTPQWLRSSTKTRFLNVTPKKQTRFQHLDHGIKTPDGTITPRVDRVLGCFRLLLHIASQRQVNVISTDTVRV